MTKKIADDMKARIDAKFGVAKATLVEVETDTRKEDFVALTNMLANQVLKQELTARHSMGSKITTKDVVDELAKRKAVFAPFFLTLDDVGYRVALKSEIAKIAQEYSEKNGEIKGFDPSTLSIDEITNLVDGPIEDSPLEQARRAKVKDLIDALQNNVVRLTFMKKGQPIRDENGGFLLDENGKKVMDGEYREMWATRNQDLVKLYCSLVRDKGKVTGGKLDDLTQEDKIDYQISKDMVTVLDLQKEEFRTFKPSTLLKVDTKAGVGSWIEFEIDNDGWFMLAKDADTNQNILGFYNGTRKAINHGISSVGRLQYEKAAVMAGQASGGLPSVEEEKEIKSNVLAVEKGLQAFRQVTYGVYYGEQYESYVEHMKEYIKALVKNKNPKIIDSGAEISSSLVKDDKTSIILNIAGVQILVNPFFIVNVKTGRKYLDRYDIFRFGRVNKDLPFAISDHLVEDELETLARKLSEVKKGVKRLRTTHEVDERRVNRMRVVSELAAGKAWLATLNAKLKVNSTGKFELVIGKNKTKVGFIIHPSYLVMLSPIDNKPVHLIKTVRYTSLISEWRDKIKQLKVVYKQYPQVIEALDVIDEIFLERVFFLKVRDIKLIPPVEDAK